MFNGKSFTFDSIPSELYNLRILNFRSSGLTSTSAGSEVELQKKWPLKKLKPYYFGRSLQTPLKIDMTIGAVAGTFIEVSDMILIKRWLLARNGYKELIIQQDDMLGYTFNCIAISGSDKYIGNQLVGLDLTFECDSPWAWTSEKTLTYTLPNSFISSFNFNFYNDSDSDDYYYPETTFTMNNIGTTFYLVNGSDGGRSMFFDELSSEEKITLDNDRQIITSSKGLRRLSNFNKHWFRLIPGMNSLTLTAGVTEFTMTYKNARKIGG